MFNFSANHLPYSRTEYPKCAVFFCWGTSTHSAFTGSTTSQALIIRPNNYVGAGKVNSADKLYLVIDSVRPDTKHSRSSHCSWFR